MTRKKPEPKRALQRYVRPSANKPKRQLNTQEEATLLIIQLKRRPVVFKELHRRIVAEGITINEVMEMRRFEAVSRVRRHFWRWLRKELRWSYPQIARLFGCDHTSVMAGIQVAEREVEVAEREVGDEDTRIE